MKKDIDRIEKFVRAQLASKKSIAIDNRLMRGLGCDNTRDLFEELGAWGYNTDFGMLAQKCDTDTQAYLRAFLRSFLD